MKKEFNNVLERDQPTNCKNNEWQGVTWEWTDVKYLKNLTHTTYVNILMYPYCVHKKWGIIWYISHSKICKYVGTYWVLLQIGVPIKQCSKDLEQARKVHKGNKRKMQLFWGAHCFLFPHSLCYSELKKQSKSLNPFKVSGLSRDPNLKFPSWIPND